MTATGRRRAWWGLGGVVGALLAAVTIGEATGWTMLRGPLQSAMTRAAGVPVRLEGPFSARLIGRPGIQVGQLVVAPGDGVPVPHLLDAQQVELEWRWSDLWRWRGGAPLRIHRLHAAVVDARLVRAADGRASWHVGMAHGNPDRPSAPPLADALPRFGSLRMAQGRIVVDDRPLDSELLMLVAGGEGEPSPGRDVKAADADPAPSASAAVPGSAPAASGATTSPSAPQTANGYTARVTGRWRALPLELLVRSGSTLPLLQDEEAARDAGGEAPDVPLRIEGRAGAATISFDGHAAALLGERRLQGRLRFRGPSLARVGEPLGITLPQSPPFDLAGELRHAGGVWHLRADRAAIGRSLLNGEFRFDTRSRPGRLTGRLGGPRLRLGDLAPALGADPAERVKGRVLPARRFDLPSLRGMTADVQVAIDELDLGSEALAPLRDLRAHLLLEGGVLDLRDLKAVVAGGQFSGSTRMDASAGPARWGADLRFSGVDIAGWLQGVRSDSGRDVAPRANDAKGLKRQREQARRGGEQPVRAYITGALSGHVQATGQGRSTAEILSTLDGQAQMMLRDGTLSHLVTELAGLDLAQALGVMVRSDRPLPLRCARVDLVMQNGVVRPRLAVLDNADSTVRVAGSVDLRNETLALQAVTRPKDFSPLSLRTPVNIGGTLAAPKVGIEARGLAGKVLGALALGAVAGPAAALLPLIDRGESDAADPCAEAPRQARPAARKP